MRVHGIRCSSGRESGPSGPDGCSAAPIPSCQPCVLTCVLCKCSQLPPSPALSRSHPPTHYLAQHRCTAPLAPALHHPVLTCPKTVSTAPHLTALPTPPYPLDIMHPALPPPGPHLPLPPTTHPTLTSSRSARWLQWRELPSPPRSPPPPPSTCAPPATRAPARAQPWSVLAAARTHRAWCPLRALWCSWRGESYARPASGPTQLARVPTDPSPAGGGEGVAGKGGGCVCCVMGNDSRAT